MLLEWVNKAEVDSGVRAGVPTELAERMKALERENRELRQANDTLRKTSADLPGGTRPSVQAMAAFSDKYGVEPICRVLPIAPSIYYERVAQLHDPLRMSARAQRDQALKPEVLRVFSENFGVYGQGRCGGR